MRGLNIRDIRNMSEDQLLDAIEDTRESLLNMRFQMASGQLEDTNGLRYAKRDLSRLLTVQRERELAAALLAEEEGNA